MSTLNTGPWPKASLFVFACVHLCVSIGSLYLCCLHSVWCCDSGACMIEGAKAKEPQVKAKVKAKVNAKVKAKVAPVAKPKAKAKVDVRNGKSSSSLSKKPASANNQPSDTGSFHTMCVCDII